MLRSWADNTVVVAAPALMQFAVYYVGGSQEIIVRCEDCLMEEVPGALDAHGRDMV